MSRLLAALRRSGAADHPASGGSIDGGLLKKFPDRRDEPVFAEIARRDGPMAWAGDRRVLRAEADFA